MDDGLSGMENGDVEGFRRGGSNSIYIAINCNTAIQYCIAFELAINCSIALELAIRY
jgi:hypothetical protein